MKKIKRIITRILSKFFPVLRLNDEILALYPKISHLYNYRPEEFYKICDILGVRHFYVAPYKYVNFWIDTDNYVYKVTVLEPKCLSKNDNEET